MPTSIEECFRVVFAQNNAELKCIIRVNVPVQRLGSGSTNVKSQLQNASVRTLDERIVEVKIDGGRATYSISGDAQGYIEDPGVNWLPKREFEQKYGSL